MPRTFKATIALILTLGIVAILTIVSIVQSHQTTREMINVRQDVNDMTRAMTRMQNQIERGGGVGGGTAAQAGIAAAAGDRYAQALNDPDNLLNETKDQLVYPDAVPGGTLRRWTSSDPAGFNWLTENSVDVRDIQFYVHNNIARHDFSDPDSYVPDLAYKVTANDDRTEYVVHLREGVYWHSPNVDMGDPRYEWLRERQELTAEDAVFFYEMAMHPEVEAAHIANYVEDIEKVEVIDRYSYRVTWDRPLYHSEYVVMIMTYPMPKWLFSRNRDGEEYTEEEIPAEFNNHWSVDTPIGTGPYTFDSFETGNRIVLELNEDYWGETPPIERIEYQIIRDPEQGFARLLSGQLDFLPSVSEPRYRSEILEGPPNSPFKNGELEHHVLDRFAYHYIGWNMDGDLFDDVRVRTAMTKALNRQGIIDNIMYGLAEIQTGPYYYNHPATNPDIEPINFSLEEAAALLDEAGWKDTTGDGIRNKTIDGEVRNFRFTLTAYNQPTVRTWTNVYREDLRTIGIDMRTDYVDWPLMQRRMEEKTFDAFTGGWGLSWFVDLYQIWHSSQADIPRGSNRVGFRHDEADEIITELRRNFDPGEREVMLHRFHEIVHEEQPYTFFYAPKNVAAWNPRLKNVIFNEIRPQAYSLPWYMDEAPQ